MTSKEAIYNIEHLFEGSSIDLSKHFEAIKQDLEILEVLKLYIKIHKDVLPNGLTYYFLNGLETDKETYEKVKEWLEND